MANEEHLAILRQDVDTWNEWRIDNPGIKPALSDARLNNADLSNANLSLATLSRADLSNTDLSDADLIGADLSDADLSRAILSNAKLSGAVLSRAILSEVDLSDADLRYANLFLTILTGADFSNALLVGADLRYAHFNDVDLSNVDLSRADLRHASLRGGILHGADLSGVRIGWTVFANVDLSEVGGLESILHVAPSTIGFDTIYKSRGNVPHLFLWGAGVPKDDIAYLLSLAGKAIDFYSCFISCSSRDKAFVDRLHADLQAKGIRCWVAWEDLKIGEPFLLGIDKGIQLHDKLLLVLSENSVTSGWVQHEVLSALAKEQGKEPWVLFPVRLDETVMHTNVTWVNMIKQSRHIGDFTQWKDHDAYQKAFDMLLRDLKMASPG